jgi:glucoamylase
MLPEQIWDEPDLPRAHLFHGMPTGAAMPLMWAHAEYIKLLRSTDDGQVYDRIAEVADRYLRPRQRTPLEVWKSNRQVQTIAAGATLRIQAARPFMLHWGRGDWMNVTDTQSQHTSIGISFVDIATAPGDGAPVRFTFYWTDQDRWEGRDYTVEVREA